MSKPEEQVKEQAPKYRPPSGKKIGDTKVHPTNPHVTLTVTGFNGDGSPVWRKKAEKQETR